MQGADHDVGVLVEDGLGAVAVVRVDVDDCDGAVDGPAKPGGGDGRVVQITGAAKTRAGRVVPRWAAARVGGGLAGEHQVGCGEGHIGRGAHRVPRARPDQGHGVVREVARLRCDRRRHGRRAVEEEAGVGEQVGDDAVLARVLRQTGRFPVFPGASQVGHQRRVVDSQEGGVGLCLRVHETRAGPRERLTDPLRPRGQLGARRANAHPNLTARVVQSVTVAPDHGHSNSHGALIPHACGRSRTVVHLYRLSSLRVICGRFRPLTRRNAPEYVP